MVRQRGGVVNFGWDHLTLSRQTFDDGYGFGEGTLQGPHPVLWRERRHVAHAHARYHIINGQRVDVARISTPSFDRGARHRWVVRVRRCVGGLCWERVFGRLASRLGENRAVVCDRELPAGPQCARPTPARLWEARAVKGFNGTDGWRRRKKSLRKSRQKLRAVLERSILSRTFKNTRYLSSLHVPIIS